MALSIDPALLVGFCFALTRAIAWAVVCPPFNSQAIPVRVRLGFAVAMSFAIAGRLAPAEPDLSTAALIGDLLRQALAGIAIGLLVLVLFSAIQAAGELIDLQVGFSLGGVIDPMSGNMASPIGRLHQLLAIAILFAINGHVLVVRGFLRSVDASPTASLDLGALSEQSIRLVGVMTGGAIEIALPVLAALFATEVALGLLGKAAPQLNVLVLGFALKSLVAFALLGTTLVLLPETTSSLLGKAVRAGLQVVGG
ncbi:MAG: flagellar biosynthetic protein FliR [Ilumatobacteraceae bacterium]